MTASIERIFLDWNRPALPVAAALLTDAYASDGSIGMGDATVVVPGGRAGRRLAELLLEESLQRGLPLDPPRVMTVGGLGDLLLGSTMRVADPATTRLTMARALREEDPGLLGTVFPIVPAANDLAGWCALARTLLGVQRDVSGGGYRFPGVAVACGHDHLLFDDRERWSVLAGVQDRYEVLLRAAGLADPDLAKLEPPTEGTEPLSDLWLVGVVDLPPTIRGLLMRRGGRIRVVVHAPEREASAFDALGNVVPGAWAERDLPIPDDSLRIVDRPGDQTAAMVRWLVDLGGANAVDDIAICATDRELVPFLEQAFEGAGVPVRFAGGTELVRTAPLRLLQAVADYLKHGDWESFAALQRHPDLPNRGRSANVGALDRYHGEHLPAGIRDVRHPVVQGGALGAARSGLDGDDLLGRFRDRRRLSHWQPEILGFLAGCYGNRRLTRDPSDRLLLGALEALRDLAGMIHEIDPAIDEVVEAHSALTLMLDLARDRTVPDEPDRDAVEILGWLELHLDDAPVGAVVGFNEPFLPESVNADGFLPDRLRVVLGLTDNAARYARDAYYLTAMLQSRSDAIMIAGRLGPAGDPLRPSRLMLATSGDLLARRILWFTGEDIAGAGGSDADAIRDDAPTSNPPAVRPRSRSSFRLPPEPTIELPAPTYMRVTDFGAVLRDPYLYALERRLNLRSRDDWARELDGPSFGTLAHRVLQIFGHSPEAASFSAAEIRECLDRALDEEVERRFGSAGFPAVALQAQQLRARLHALARWQAHHIRDGWRIQYVEGSPAGSDPDVEPLTLTTELLVDGEAMPIQGRIDRIDRHSATGDWLILDYKTGDSPETPEAVHRFGPRDAREWKDLQLPLYRHLAATLTETSGGASSVGSVGLGYVLLPRSLERVGASLADWSDAELTSADDRARDVVRQVRSGTFSFDVVLTGRHRRGPLAPLLGLRQLVIADDDEDDLEAEVLA